jgi:hypothetical protein
MRMDDAAVHELHSPKWLYWRHSNEGNLVGLMNMAFVEPCIGEQVSRRAKILVLC